MYPPQIRASWIPTSAGCFLVFFRQWIEHQGLVFEEVITAERLRVINRLDEKLADAQAKARVPWRLP